jgi:D-3-phosphoglycerate dehydrogenase
MKKKWAVLCATDVSAFPEVLDPLKDVAKVKICKPGHDALLREIRDADAFIASLHVRLDAEAIAAAKKLRVIATPSTKLDHLDLKAADARGITLLSLKYDREFLDTVTATAEFAWALMLACLRRIPWAFDAVKRGEWARDKFRGHQLSGKTFGILGYGRLGAMVGEYARAFRMRVLAHDFKDFQAEGIERVDKQTLFRESDVISLHVPLTPETTNLVDRKEFALMKPGAIIVNTSRGAIINQEALLEAIKTGRIAGAGLDVIHWEWPDVKRHPLMEYARTHENLVIVPHLGDITYESQAMSLHHIAEKLGDFIRADKE